MEDIKEFRKKLVDAKKFLLKEQKKSEKIGLGIKVQAITCRHGTSVMSVKTISKIWLKNRILKKEMLISRKTWGFDERISYDEDIAFDVFDEDYRPYFLQDELKDCLIFGEKKQIMRLLLPNSRIALLKLID